MNRVGRRLVFFLVLIFLVSTGCLAASEVEETSQTAIPPSETNIPTATSLPTITPPPTTTYTPSPTPIVVLDPEPINIEFTAIDGQELSGIYYPASENPAPLAVLVHWAEGDQTEWKHIATWLQNRGSLIRETDHNNSWLSSDWFPDNTYPGPLGVFTFNLRECTGECQAYLPTEWLLDMEAAMQTAAHLQGVDREQIITVGASIGADAALYGCDWLNREREGVCRGTFSLSPASLLTIPYDQLVNDLIGIEPGVKIYCLYGLRDDASLETCGELPGITGIDYGYIENHGLELIQPGLQQDTLLHLLEFIQASLGEE